MLIDSHVNLHAPQFDADRAEVIARARAAGVALMVNICDKVSGFAAVEALAEANSDIWATVGTHPHEAKENPGLADETLCDLAGRPRVVGIGETGLDFHYDLSARDVQIAVFRAHIEAARRTGLPLVVHSREADTVMGDILEEEHAKAPFRLLMHCYTSGAELARRAAALGAWFSVSGIATFKAAEAVRAVIADMPQDRIIVETDCPYLAPVPMRGRRNEPAFLPHILARVAEVRGWSAPEAETRTQEAFFNLFDKIPEAIVTGALEIVILGCGSSGGVPRADGAWGACDPNNRRNWRTRCSLLVRRVSDGAAEAQTTLVVDASPEFRLQAAAGGVKRLDGLLLTHEHADQCHGIDDIRAFALRQRQRIPCWMDEATREVIIRRFGYIFEGAGLYPAIAEAWTTAPHGERWSVDGPSGPIPVTTFEQEHGEVNSLGYRFGSIAYSSDVFDLPEASFAALRDLDLWIVDALRYTPHPTHAHVEKALAWIARVKPRRAILTNMHIDLDYAELARRLPPGVEPAYDGLQVRVALSEADF